MYQVKAAEARVELARLHAEMQGAGTAYLFNRTQIEAAIEDLRRYGYGAEEAREAVKTVSTATGTNSSLLRQSIDALHDTAAAYGGLGNAAKEEAEAASDPRKELEKLRPTLERTNPTLLRHIEYLINTGDEAEAAAEELAYMQRTAHNLGEETMGPFRKAWNEIVTLFKTPIRADVRVEANTYGPKYDPNAASEAQAQQAEDHRQELNAAIAKGNTLIDDEKGNSPRCSKTSLFSRRR